MYSTKLGNTAGLTKSFRHLVVELHRYKVISRLSLNIVVYFKPFSPAGKPSPPIINNSETETLGCHVNVTWSKPHDNGCPLTKYSVYFIQVQLQETEEPWYEVQTTDILKTYRVLRLSCDTQYMIEMSAWNELG